jgi:nucleoside-diphosphate kinase
VSQRTFSIIKPDAVRKGYTAAILAEIEKAGFQIVSIKKQSISKPQAEGFYAVHSARPFFDSLTTFMSSGPIVLLVLEKENAIADLRKLMGATNPANAEEGTIRKKFAGSIEENAIHGSDAPETRRLKSAIGSRDTSWSKALAQRSGPQPKQSIPRSGLQTGAACNTRASRLRFSV